MRISYWSSDVCSSDLNFRSTNHIRKRRRQHRSHEADEGYAHRNPEIRCRSSPDHRNLHRLTPYAPASVTARHFGATLRTAYFSRRARRLRHTLTVRTCVCEGKILSVRVDIVGC